METHICVYCGGEASYQFKNGNWCCCNNVAKCPASRNKIRTSRIGTHHSSDWRHSISEGLRKSAIFEKKEIRICSFCGEKRFTSKSGISCHERYCKMNPNAAINPFTGKCHSQKSKNLISDKMKKAHEEGRAGTWIGLRKRSFAEQYWFNIFERNLGANTFTNNFHVKECHYWLDFAWPEKKIYFEVDGVTHYTEEGKKHDAIRTERLNELGWRLIGRCNWSEYQRLSNEQRGQYVSSVLKMISQP